MAEEKNIVLLAYSEKKKKTNEKSTETMNENFLLCC